MQFTADDRRAQDLLISANNFDDSIEFEDKTFESMLQSLPLHGWTWRNVCYAKICCSATCSLPETLSQWSLYASLGKRMLLLCLQARYSCLNSALPHKNVDKQLEF